MRGVTKLHWWQVGGVLGVTAVLTLLNYYWGTLTPVQATPLGVHTQFLPTIMNGTPLNCRFGVNVIESFANLQIDDLPLGWYVNYQANPNPVRPSGAHYGPIIRLTQTGPNAADYTYSPSGAALLDAIDGNPGAYWFIGNEPDRRIYQDDIEPHVYAAAYHELYTTIKTADPTARIFAGTIVQPTPIRLQYLDMILASYEQQNGGASLPADGWSIHNFILNEVSCDHDPNNCWGAEIPPGIDAPSGEIIAIEDNDNITMFQDRLVAFRQWMFDNGYNELPLLVSEYGVLMPDWLGFPPARVNTFMDASVNYMLTATDPLLGDPHDGYRLVQGWSWYSTGAPTDEFNGYLFANTSPPRALSVMGQNYAALIDEQSPEVDYYPTALLSETVTLSSSITVTLQATIANSGNTALITKPILVRFYDDDPAGGGVQIGSDQSLALMGCGTHQTVEISWPAAAPGVYDIYVVTDVANNVSETNEANNVASFPITITSTP
ncbi:MAG: hypothetical protein H6658_05635 [Ardenticatenaceae bacterium]|nr:hypothetical protein [Ardenticatenaceae bacterium]